MQAQAGQAEEGLTHRALPHQAEPAVLHPMKLKELTAKRFQSLWDVSLKLGDLTVIVGPSSSGKSALGRALRTVLRNSQSSNFVSFGAKTALVSVKTDMGETLTIERGPGASSYRMVLPSGDEEVYAKAGSSVPEDIEKVVNLPLVEGSDINLTTQFDGPFLLDESGPRVSAILGSLTNVTMLAAAAKEANRRRLECQRTATIRQKDVETTVATLRTKYSNLGARQHAMEEARALISSIHDQASRADRLDALVGQIHAAEAASVQVSAQLKKQTALVEIMDSSLDELNSKLARLQTLVAALRTWKTADNGLKDATVAHAQALDSYKQAHERAEEALLGLETCPLCGSAIEAH